MKVRSTTDPQTGRSIPASSKGKMEGSSGATEKSTFQSILDEVLPPGDEAVEALNQLWSRLPEVEKELLAHPGDENLKKYRELIRNIVGATLKQSTRVTEMRKRSRDGTERQARVVSVIDERLHRMPGIIGSKKNAAFQLLKSVEEIRGLLIDLKDRFQYTD